MVKNPSFQDEHFVVLVAFVAGDDDAFALLQAFQHLVVLGVLTSDADLAAVCFLAVLVEDENPVAARYFTWKNVPFGMRTLWVGSPSWRSM